MVVRSVVKLNEQIIQYGKVCHFQDRDLMTGIHFVKMSQDSRDTSFVRVECYHFSVLQILSTLLWYTLYVDQHARHRQKTPDLEEKMFFGQLN